MEEILKDMNGKYWVSNLGRIKSKTKVLKPALKKERRILWTNSIVMLYV